MTDQKTTLLDRFKAAGPIFIFTVIVPTALALLYFGVIANDVYISESRFVVRSPSKANSSPLSLMLNGGGLSAGGSEESNAVADYLQSRRALDETDKDGLVRRAYGADRAGLIDRFGGLSGDSREQLYKYFLKKVAVENDTPTQVVLLSVRAFDPKEAQLINQRLLEQSEALVNRLSERARADSVAIATKEVDAAKLRSREAALALARYRNQAGIIDPEKEATVRLQMVSKLQDELISVRTQLDQMQSYTPSASQIPFLRTRIRSLEREIDQQMSGISGGKRSLSAAAAKYQELLVDSELAEKQLAATVASLQEAQNDARRKRAYVERIADPNLPDYPLEPRRTRGIVATFILGLLAWGVLSTLLVGIKEHRD